MNTWMRILVVAATVLAFASPVIADRERWGGSRRGPGYIADIAETPGLALTAEQAERIDALREDHLKDIGPIKRELDEKSRALRNLWLAHRLDSQRIEASQAEAMTVRERLMKRIETYNAEVYLILTPEQQASVQFRNRGLGGVRMGGGMEGGRMGGLRREKGMRPEQREPY